jgi:hypothetical protein
MLKIIRQIGKTKCKCVFERTYRHDLTQTYYSPWKKIKSCKGCKMPKSKYILSIMPHPPIRRYGPPPYISKVGYRSQYIEVDKSINRDQSEFLIACGFDLKKITKSFKPTYCSGHAVATFIITNIYSKHNSYSYTQEESFGIMKYILSDYEDVLPCKNCCQSFVSFIEMGFIPSRAKELSNMRCCIHPIGTHDMCEDYALELIDHIMTSEETYNDWLSINWEPFVNRGCIS